MYFRNLNIHHCLILMLLLGVAFSAHAAEKQVATFANIEFLEDEVVAGIRGLGIRFDVQMKYKGEDVLNKGESSVRYGLSAWLFDDHGVALPATVDAEKYISETGQCRDSTSLVQGKFHKDFTGETMFIPYYALAMLPGKRKVQLELQLVDRRNGSLVGKSVRKTFSFDKPACKRFRMDMKFIEVTEKDANGDTWDYYFLNPKEVYPDIRWSLRRGRSMVYVGERQKNLVVYEGDPEQDRTAYFTLSEGDRLSLHVADFDLISFSDEIGKVELDPWTGRLAEGKLMDLRFGQVTSALFQLENLSEPLMLLSGFDVVENVQERGVTGVRIAFDYQLKYNVLGARFVVQLQEFMAGMGYTPRFARVVQGKAEAAGPGTFRLAANKGKLALFIPWYGLEPKPDAESKPLIRLSGSWQYNEQEFALGLLQRELIAPEPEVADLVFGQWKAGQADRNGMAGILFSCEYKLSGRYLQDLDSAEIRLYPEMRSQQGPIPAGYLEHIAPEGAEWIDNGLVITPAVDTGSLDLFMPYHQMPEGLSALELALDYHADLSWEGREQKLGVFRLQQEISLPDIREMKLAVKEVAAGRNGFMGSQPNLEWRIRIGDKEMYRSRTIYNAKTARWEPDESVTLRLTDQDLVKIEIYQVVDEEAQLASSWSGRLGDFPVTPSGAWKLKMEGLRRVLVDVQ